MQCERAHSVESRDRGDMRGGQGAPLALVEPLEPEQHTWVPRRRSAHATSASTPHAMHLGGFLRALGYNLQTIVAPALERPVDSRLEGATRALSTRWRACCPGGSGRGRGGASPARRGDVGCGSRRRRLPTSGAARPSSSLGGGRRAIPVISRLGEVETRPAKVPQWHGRAFFTPRLTGSGPDR